MLLIALALATAALFGLGALAAMLPPLRRWLPATTAVLCAAAAAGSAAALAAGAAPVLLLLPVGLPGVGMTLALDGLSGWFLLLVFCAGTAASLAGKDVPARLRPLLPVFLGAMALTLLAGDVFTLLLGFELMSLASYLLVAGQGEAAGPAALLYGGLAALASVCLIGAFGLMIRSPELGFAALRAAPPDGWRAGAAVVLLLVGAGSKAGLVPLHVWLPPAHAAAPAPVSALMSGAMTKVALYVLVRGLFDLAGPAPPAWWGLALVAAGTASAVLGALRATQEADTKEILACSTIESVGLVAAGLGVALAARAADLTPLAVFALAAALLHAMAHGLFKPLLFLAAGAVQHGAGSRILARLGGLAASMKVTTLCVLVGAAALAGVPPGVGFAGEWMLIQSVLGAVRLGGLATQTGFAMAAAALALAMALGVAAAVRLVGVAFLGRPRTPRAAAAEEAGVATGAATGAAMIGLAVLATALGLFPGAALRLAGPALHRLLGATLDERAGWLGIAVQPEGARYAPLMLAVLLAVLAVACRVLVRRFAPRGVRRAPAWNCGFAPAPAWLPFGDPLTQYGGASFSHILRRTLGAALLAAGETVTVRAPGETAPAGIVVRSRDPADALIFGPAGRWREKLSAAADRAQLMPIRALLVVTFALLVTLLAVVALLETR